MFRSSKSSRLGFTMYTGYFVGGKHVIRVASRGQSTVRLPGLTHMNVVP